MKIRDSDVLAWVRGHRKTSQLLGTFGLLDLNHVTARSRLAHVLKLTKRLFLQFSNFFSRAAVNRGYWTSAYGGTTVLCSIYWRHKPNFQLTPIRT
jgi:hypothetical protein